MSYFLRISGRINVNHGNKINLPPLLVVEGGEGGSDLLKYVMFYVTTRTFMICTGCCFAVVAECFFLMLLCKHSLEWEYFGESLL